MKDYKRLTEGYFECSRCEKGICEIPNSLCKDSLYCEIHNRLFDLEDKIESGELVEVPKGAVALTPEERADKVRLTDEERKQAVKEFAERVKMAFYYEFDELMPSIMADKIDELVKEVCGE